MFSQAPTYFQQGFFSGLEEISPQSKPLCLNNTPPARATERICEDLQDLRFNDDFHR
ncbi:hypothetical protein J2Z66_004836 [Paenibacillus eucommiae]|uniref:Uncharacterized protein n=1 Tax=Paenibacillus eucommiae TaxID=1355755 RepID=A0ABS4J054_9BACL|nr:hypothetical protein [Paenibacillus eucommiae]